MIEIPIPVAKARVDNIVARTDWTKHTSCILRIAGVEGEEPPVLRNQDPLSGMTDILLARCIIQPSGVITVEGYDLDLTV